VRDLNASALTTAELNAAVGGGAQARRTTAVLAYFYRAHPHRHDEGQASALLPLLYLSPLYIYPHHTYLGTRRATNSGAGRPASVENARRNARSVVGAACWAGV